MATMPHDPYLSAREFYRDCMMKSFSHTRRFAAQVGRVADDVLNNTQFEAVLREGTAGSLDAARRIGDMIAVHMDAVPNQPGPWWRELCTYEKAHFMQAATTQTATPANRPRRGVSAMCANFKWNMPELIKRLGSGEVIAEELNRPVTLLFSRGRDGKVHVVEVGPPVEKVFRATNGPRIVEQIAGASDVSLDETQKILNALSDIGAIELAKTSEQMIDAIRKNIV
jgi:hypothetical protein